MGNKILIIYPSTNRHLGLWDDLINDNRVYLRCSAPKKISKWLKPIRKVHLSTKINQLIKIPNKHYWYEFSDLYELTNHVTQILIIDGALSNIKIDELAYCRTINPAIKINLFFLNAIKGESQIMNEIRTKYENFKWDNIYTFDPLDALNYQYQYLGFNYYSRKDIKTENISENEIYFIGGVKGNRTNTIIEVFEFLTNNNVKSKFTLFNSTKTIKHKDIQYIQDNWISYEEILNNIAKSNCILEILQRNQYGATLRYFEAVCYNKKLLTNNPEIINFPFYNSKWMKIFKNIEDIDLDWIHNKENINYNYKNEFSPKNLINILINNSHEEI